MALALPNLSWKYLFILCLRYIEDTTVFSLSSLGNTCCPIINISHNPAANLQFPRLLESLKGAMVSLRKMLSHESCNTPGQAGAMPLCND